MSKYIIYNFCKILVYIFLVILWTLIDCWLFSSCCLSAVETIWVITWDTIHSVSCSVSFNMDWMFIQCLFHANKNTLLLRLNWGKTGVHMNRHATKELQNCIYRLTFLIKLTEFELWDFVSYYQKWPVLSFLSAHCLCPFCSPMFFTP